MKIVAMILGQGPGLEELLGSLKLTTSEAHAEREGPQPVVMESWPLLIAIEVAMIRKRTQANADLLITMNLPFLTCRFGSR